MKNLSEDQEKIKVIYITGSGRSGSTILNIILDNHPEVFGGGELQNMNSVFNENKICSCGEATVNCELWSTVMSEWLEEIPDSTVKEGLSKWKKFESYSSLKAWLRLWSGLSLESPEVQDYMNNTYTFFKTLSKHSGKKAILDISKNPLRAWALLNHPKIDLRLVHLVRDGRGVAWSLEKKAKREDKPRAIWRTALFWLLVNRQSNYVRKKAKNAQLIRYEDFAKNPKETLIKIGEVAGLDVTPITDMIDANSAFNISHVVAGNAIRKANSIKLRFDDDEWLTKLDVDSQKKFYSYTRTTMKSYGYA
ncbi:sulfotransferase [Formosa sp. PL04]|uniref:sulfotransferase n=1 Tax=Formosa sp. PL04 TaxID=3081755 RepID=UPI0029827355|nr:sulfotransferase [Formosa sp. PL04]MDW5289366.1 sulfotransferase [Formosa sp. PL04]